MRICTDCNLEKSPEHFYKKSGSKDGYSSQCKVCINKKQKIWRKNNRELKKERDRNYQRSNKDYINRKNREWRDRNRDKDRDLKRKWYLDNKEFSDSCSREWKKKNKSKVAAYSSARRAKIKGLTYEEVDREFIFKRDLGVCYLCKNPVDPNNWHLDHKIPVSRIELNPTHTYDNLAVSHPVCNTKKGAMTPEEYYKKIKET